MEVYFINNVCVFLKIPFPFDKQPTYNEDGIIVRHASNNERYACL